MEIVQNAMNNPAVVAGLQKHLPKYWDLLEKNSLLEKLDCDYKGIAMTSLGAIVHFFDVVCAQTEENAWVCFSFSFRRRYKKKTTTYY